MGDGGSKMSTSEKSPIPPPAPVESAGQWVAWNQKWTEIFAHGRVFEEVYQEAIQRGCTNPIMQHVRDPRRGLIPTIRRISSTHSPQRSVQDAEENDAINISEKRKTSIPTPAPVEYAGQWVAWNRDRTEVVAHGDDVVEVHKSAIAKGLSKPILQKVRQPGAMFLGWL
jgi:Family of unknown function (DUF5678)